MLAGPAGRSPARDIVEKNHTVASCFLGCKKRVIGFGKCLGKAVARLVEAHSN